MIDEHQQELASLYVFELLEGADRAGFETELARNPELQQLVRELRESTANLALTTKQVSPPPELKSRVLANLGTVRATPTDNVVRPAVFNLARLLPWAIAASIALACAGLGQLYLAGRAENSLLRDQQTLAELELRSARQRAEAERLLAARQLDDANRELAGVTAQLSQVNQQLADANQQLTSITSRAGSAEERIAAADKQISELRERLQTQGELAQFKIATLASLAGNSPEALAVAVWNPATQQGVLRVDKLPALASDKDYQLWVIDPAYPVPVDGGVFTVDPATGHAQVNFRPNKPVTNAAKFAISLERKGGVPKAEGPILLIGD